VSSGEDLIKATLDARRVREADLRFATYVSPDGRGYHRVRLAGSGTIILVASAVGSRTFAPSELILLGSNSGRFGFVLLGSSPPGGQGASGFPPSTPLVFAADSILITAAVPDTVSPGETVDVDVFGYGLLPSVDSWSIVTIPSALDLSPVTLDTAATVLSWESLDPESEGYTLAPGQSVVRVTIEVADDAPAGHGLTFRVERETAITLSPDLVTVEVPPAPPEPDHYALIISDLTDPTEAIGAYFLGGISGGVAIPRQSTGTFYSRVSPAATAIHEAGAVGAESIVYRAGGTDPVGDPTGDTPRLIVMDSATGNLLTWNPADGFDVTPAVLGHDGRLWFVEWEIGSHAPDPPGAAVSTIRIRSSDTDLSDVTEHATFDFVPPGGIAHAIICPRITEDDLYFGWAYGFSETSGYVDYIYPLAGGELIDRTDDWDEGHNGIDLGSNPHRSNTGAYGILAGEGNGCSYILGETIWRQSADRTPPVLAWPISEAWPVVNQSLDWSPLSGLLVYGNQVAVRGPVTAAEDSTPIEVTDVEFWLDVENDTNFPVQAYFFRIP